MPAKPRRRSSPPRKSPARPQRRGAGSKFLLAIVALLVVFCVAAGTTLWFTAGRQLPEVSGAADPPPAAGERLSPEERKALDEILRNTNPKKP